MSTPLSVNVNSIGAVNSIVNDSRDNGHPRRSMPTEHPWIDDGAPTTRQYVR